MTTPQFATRNSSVDCLDKAACYPGSMTEQDPPTQPTQFAHSLLDPMVKRTRTFVLRLVVDAQGEVRGAVSEPGSEDEWRSTIVSLDNLCSSLGKRLRSSVPTGRNASVP